MPTNMMNWTKKFSGIDEVLQENYPVILVEMNSVGKQVAKWLIQNCSEQETANKIRLQVAAMVSPGEDGPPLTEADIAKIKQAIADLG